MRLDIAGNALVLISSLLLGIWATVDTIALRNGFIWIGSLVSFIYWWNWFRLKKINHFLPSFSKLYFIAVILIIIMFIWVIAHYFFYSHNTEQQFQELKSTWLRSFLAAIIGSATGLALNRNTRLIPFLWLGLVLSFIFLIYQYIPKALINNSIFAIDWFGDYIYWAKFNGVLAGIFLIAGLLGLLFDVSLRHINNSKKIDALNIINVNSISSNKFAELKKNYYFKNHKINFVKIENLAFLIYIFTGISMPIYTFVFIFDAKIGIAISFILLITSLLIGVTFIKKIFIKVTDKKRKINLIKKLIIAFFLISASLSWYAINHLDKNPNWINLFEDLSIGAQIENYQNWKNPLEHGLPLRADGSEVQGSAYVRVAWALVGLEKILNAPFGGGVFRNFHIQVKDQAPNLSQVTAYSHSAWIDIGLAFGIPGLLLLPAALIIFLIIAIIDQSIYFKWTIIFLVFTILILYLVGEHGFQHGIEILLYFCGLIGGLCLASK